MVSTTALDVCCMFTVTNQLGRDGLNPFWCRGKMCGACWIEWYEVCVCWISCVCAGRKVLVLLGDFNMAPDKEGWCAHAATHVC